MWRRHVFLRAAAAPSPPLIPVKVVVAPPSPATILSRQWIEDLCLVANCLGTHTKHAHKHDGIHTKARARILGLDPADFPDAPSLTGFFEVVGHFDISTDAPNVAKAVQIVRETHGSFSASQLCEILQVCTTGKYADVLIASVPSLTTNMRDLSVEEITSLLRLFNNSGIQCPDPLLQAMTSQLIVLRPFLTARVAVNLLNMFSMMKRCKYSTGHKLLFLFLEEAITGGLVSLGVKEILSAHHAFQRAAHPIESFARIVLNSLGKHCLRTEGDQERLRVAFCIFYSAGEIATLVEALPTSAFEVVEEVIRGLVNPTKAYKKSVEDTNLLKPAVARLNVLMSPSDNSTHNLAAMCRVLRNLLDIATNHYLLTRPPKPKPTKDMILKNRIQSRNARASKANEVKPKPVFTFPFDEVILKLVLEKIAARIKDATGNLKASDFALIARDVNQHSLCSLHPDLVTKITDVCVTRVIELSNTVLDSPQECVRLMTPFQKHPRAHDVVAAYIKTVTHAAATMQMTQVLALVMGMQTAGLRHEECLMALGSRAVATFDINDGTSDFLKILSAFGNIRVRHEPMLTLGFKACEFALKTSHTRDVLLCNVMHTYAVFGLKHLELFKRITGRLLVNKSAAEPEAVATALYSLAALSINIPRMVAELLPMVRMSLHNYVAKDVIRVLYALEKFQASKHVFVAQLSTRLVETVDTMDPGDLATALHVFYEMPTSSSVRLPKETLPELSRRCVAVAPQFMGNQIAFALRSLAKFASFTQKESKNVGNVTHDVAVAFIERLTHLTLNESTLPVIFLALVQMDTKNVNRVSFLISQIPPMCPLLSPDGVANLLDAFRLLDMKDKACPLTVVWARGIALREKNELSTAMAEAMARAVEWLDGKKPIKIIKVG